MGPCCGLQHCLQRAGLREGREPTPRSKLFTYLDVFAPDSEASSQALPPSAHGQWDRPCLQPHHRLAPVSLLSDEHTVLDPQSRMVGGVLCLHFSGWSATARRLEPGAEALGYSPGLVFPGTRVCRQGEKALSRFTESLLPYRCLAAGPVSVPHAR